MSIYDEIGGADAVGAAVDQFYERVLADPALSPYFVDADVRTVKAHQRMFIGAAIGGPERYEGRDMGAAHEALHITPAHFDLVVGHLVATLTALGVPEDTIGQIGATLGPLKPVIATGEDTPVAS